MRDFFKGWRRKVGCITLVMACLLISGWLRSLQSLEFVEFPSGQNLSLPIVSWDGNFQKNMPQATNPHRAGFHGHIARATLSMQDWG